MRPGDDSHICWITQRGSCHDQPSPNERDGFLDALRTIATTRLVIWHASGRPSSAGSSQQYPQCSSCSDPCWPHLQTSGPTSPFCETGSAECSLPLWTFTVMTWVAIAVVTQQTSLDAYALWAGFSPSSTRRHSGGKAVSCHHRSGSCECPALSNCLASCSAHTRCVLVRQVGADGGVMAMTAVEVFEADIPLPNVASLQTRPARNDEPPVDLRPRVAGFLRMAPRRSCRR